jgi:Flp pilus assembly protein CpaB
MKPKTLILLMVAVSCGVVAMILVANLRAKPTTQGEKYLVAVTDLEPGTKISNAELQFREQDFIAGTAPPKALTMDDVRAKPDKLIGRVLVRPLARNEAITERHLKDDSIAEKLKPGERAISVPVKMDTVVSGFTLPGNKVDLVCTYTEGAKSISRTFLQNVPVLAVNIETTRPETGNNVAAPTTVTLAVKAQDAERVAWALKQSQYITLTLRNLTDGSIAKLRGVTGLEAKNESGTNTDEPGDDKKAVLVAKKDIALNEAIVKPEEMFEVKQLPKEFFTSDYLSDIADPYFQTKDLKAKVELKKGEFVTRRFLGAPAGPAITTDVQPSSQFVQKFFNGPGLTRSVYEWRNGAWVTVSSDATGSTAPPADTAQPTPMPPPSSPGTTTPGTRPGSPGQ